jgi:hypothetical protein
VDTIGKETRNAPPVAAPSPGWLACVIGAMLGLAACQPASDAGSAVESAPPVAETPAPPLQSAPLPLRIPILVLMVGDINAASGDVFRTNLSDKDLSDQDWLRMGEAAVSLTADATLITMPGTGPNDANWVADSRWMQSASDMQTASFDIGAAASRKDRAALSEATARLAQSCQSCHLVFSPHLVTSPPEAAPGQ